MAIINSEIALELSKKHGKQITNGGKIGEWVFYFTVAEIRDMINEALKSEISNYPK